MLSKIIPSAVMAMGAAKGADKFKPLMNYTQVVAVQSEVAGIAKIKTAKNEQAVHRLQ